MSEDRLFFEPLSRVHPHYLTPHVAVILAGIQGVVYVLLATALSGSKAFNSLISACVIGNLPFCALGVGSIFVFRRREKKRAAAALLPIDDSLIDAVAPGHAETHPHPYAPPVHTPLFPLPPILFIGSTLLLIANTLATPESRVFCAIVLATIGLGAPIYWRTVARRL
jgi:amino acid transporter